MRLARPVDLLLDPVRRAYGLTERTLVRVRSDAKDPDGRRQRARQSDRLNVTFLGGVDIAAPAALALVMCAPASSRSLLPLRARNQMHVCDLCAAVL